MTAVAQIHDAAFHPSPELFIILEVMTAGTRRDNDIVRAQDFFVFMPSGDVPERIGSHYKEQLRRSEFVLQPSQCLNCVRLRWRLEFYGRDEHRRRMRRRQRQHRHAVERGTDNPLALVWGSECRDKEHSVQIESARYRLGHFNMAVMNRIERASINSNSTAQTFLVHTLDPKILGDRPLKRLST